MHDNDETGLVRGTVRRARHRRFAGACLTGLLLTLTGCASVPEPTIVDGAQDVWSIGVSDPRFKGEERCDDDPAIDTTLFTADLPTSRIGVTLRTEATEEDAQRIAECLGRALRSGAITIRSPRAP